MQAAAARGTAALQNPFNLNSEVEKSSSVLALLRNFGVGGGCGSGVGDKGETRGCGRRFRSCRCLRLRSCLVALGEDGFIVTDLVGDQVPDDACQLVSHGVIALGAPSRAR